MNILATYLILLLIDVIWEKSVSFRLNLDNLLVAVIVSGAMTALSKEKPKRQEKGSGKIPKKDYIVMSISGAGGAVVVYSKIALIGTLSIPISLISGMLIISLLFLMLRES